MRPGRVPLRDTMTGILGYAWVSTIWPREPAAFLLSADPRQKTEAPLQPRLRLNFRLPKASIISLLLSTGSAELFTRSC